ncbi:MAG: epoxyqueuosine reductase QueH [Dysgonamonadaceae bacterium]|jgi:predicted adenine nucleotide alpha hydrolase (AANH) superfamily ATPase|nr:epoxyqueuosine reductase QueH [Dysgonamonadaceae bacterium]
MKLLLHTCCAPCSAAIIEYLLQRDIRPVLFYYNPNIFPFEEYELRKSELTRYAASLGLEVIDGDYAHNQWLNAVTGMENEPERGKRCSACFRHRLSVAAKLASERGFDTIATTLASSRWKNIDQIAEAGQEAVAPYPNLAFWNKNWRKEGLSERRNILLKANGFYNQTYCGCEFSKQ